jgi:hypothetical protein
VPNYDVIILASDEGCTSKDILDMKSGGSEQSSLAGYWEHGNKHSVSLNKIISVLAEHNTG